MKLENVLLVSKTTPLIKLCDFGCSKVLSLHTRMMQLNNFRA